MAAYLSRPGCFRYLILSDRRQIIILSASLPLRRAYGSVYGGSLVPTYFQIKLCECRISRFAEFPVVKYILQHEISGYAGHIAKRWVYGDMKDAEHKNAFAGSMRRTSVKFSFHPDLHE